MIKARIKDKVHIMKFQLTWLLRDAIIEIITLLKRARYFISIENIHFYCREKTRDKHYSAAVEIYQTSAALFKTFTFRLFLLLLTYLGIINNHNDYLSVGYFEEKKQ